MISKIVNGLIVEETLFTKQKNNFFRAVMKKQSSSWTTLTFPRTGTVNMNHQWTFSDTTTVIPGHHPHRRVVADTNQPSKIYGVLCFTIITTSS